MTRRFDATDREDGRLHPDGHTPGTAAGEKVRHRHVIPRHAGDVADPRGAVPERRVY